MFLISSLLMVFLITTLMFLRPSLFAQNYAYIGLVTSCLSIFLITLYCKVKLSRAALRYLLIFILFWCSLLISTLFNQGGLLVFLSSVVTNLIPIVCFLLWFSTNNRKIDILLVLSKVVAFLGVSSLITFIIYSVMGAGGLLLYKFEIFEYPNAGLLYLPFSIASGEFNTNGLTLLRFSSFMREPGIMQALATFCYSYTSIFYSRKKWILTGCFIAMFLTFSIPGYTVFLISIFFIHLVRSNNKVGSILYGFIVFMISIAVFLFAPYIGYYAKKTSHTSSISGRTDALLNGFQNFINTPFGIGYLKDDSSVLGNINLIASLGYIGFHNFLLVIILYVFPLFIVGKNGSYKYLAITLPFFITMLFFQPLFDTPFFWCISLFWICLERDVNDSKGRSELNV
ncbi:MULTISPECIES: hypothetical protein [unclassified Pseudoalteromonas]|uniref:hypothetical protein n=1 Tax=unclassified Pseudoalteromonas TaxID=194690 RepID=UPI003015238D